MLKFSIHYYSLKFLKRSSVVLDARSYSRRDFYLTRFDPSWHLIEPRIWIYVGSYLHLGDTNNVGHPNLVQWTLFSIFMDYGVNISYFAHLSGTLLPREPSLGRYSLTFMCFWSFMSPFLSF